jgi:hypothetical protein
VLSDIVGGGADMARPLFDGDSPVVVHWLPIELDVAFLSVEARGRNDVGDTSHGLILGVLRWCGR